MQFYVRARPVRKGVDFLSKLGSDLDERMQFRALLAADSRSQTIHSIATPSFLAARGYSRTSSSRDECAADSIGASTITVRANSGNSHSNQWLLKLLAKEEGNESYGYSNNNWYCNNRILNLLKATHSLEDAE